MSRERLFWRRKNASLERLVDLPTPLTPTIEITKGRGGEDRRLRLDGELTADIERRISSDVVGVRIFRRDDSIAARTTVSTPLNQHISSLNVSASGGRKL